jgi:thiamine-monophosphate kinase
MMDSSDGLARSCHQLAEASDSGLALDGDAVPVDDAVHEVAEGEATVRELGWYFGEDFELVCTVPAEQVDDARADCTVPLTVVGEVTKGDGDGSVVTVDGGHLPDRGFTHGE